MSIVGEMWEELWEKREQEIEEREAHWKEYIALLNKQTENTIGWAISHGWRCPKEWIQEGRRLRKLLGIQTPLDLEEENE